MWEISAFIDLTGQRFGRLIVIERAENIKGKAAWKCKCDCDKTLVVSSNNLRKGNTLSCGCLQKETIKAQSRIEGVRVSNLKKRKCENASSKYKGVYFHKTQGKWLADIGLNGKSIYLGRYNSEEEAHEVRVIAEKILHRPFLLMEADLKKKKILTDRIGISEEEAEQLLENEWLQNQIQKALEYIEAS